MAIRKLIYHTLRFHNYPRSPPVRHYSTHSPAFSTPHSTPPSSPSPPPPSFMIYDSLAESVKSKLNRLENPDPRFLRYGSPNPTLADHTSILSFPATRITTLPNGLRVATQSNLAARSASVGVWIESGSRFESEERNGVSNFLKHLALKGTESGALEEIENVGGHFDGFTSREMTAYYTQVTDRNVAKGIEILGKILQNSDYSEDTINSVRDVVLREREEVGTIRDEVIFDHLHATAFQYSPLGKSVLGPLKNIKSITKADIQDHISTHYATHRMVISAAGGVKHEDVVEQVKRVFTKLSANPTTTSQLVANEPANFTGSEVRIIDDDIPLARFAVAFNAASWTDPDSIALMIMQTMLGSWNKSEGGGKHMGSELVQRDTGLFGVYAVAKPDCLDDLSYAIMYELSKLSYRVSEADVIRARNQLKSSLLLHMNGISAAAEDIGRQLLTYGRRIPFAELFARIDAVDSNTVKRVANRFIFDRDIAIAAMGPIQGLPDYNWFRRRTYWLRY
ncbi:hypothetical protein Nepgr_029422 [Nepenthes gracilis]|uniref:Mitochondrial processing peptidase n=1 Tax=Nepenthes gracilis TaxID=150966 RepID=A0AAD3TE11_NEPGR|nr:hypothetical protein Nepgr_029422 [Nepenthes gracilis]